MGNCPSTQVTFYYCYNGARMEPVTVTVSPSLDSNDRRLTILSISNFCLSPFHGLNFNYNLSNGNIHIVPTSNIPNSGLKIDRIDIKKNGITRCQIDRDIYIK